MALGFLIRAIQFPMRASANSRSVVRRADRGTDPQPAAARQRNELDHSLSANLVLRNLELTLFLAQVGMSSGPKFAATSERLLMLGLGALVLIALVLPILILGLMSLHALRRGRGHRHERLRQPGDLAYSTSSRRPTGRTSATR
jgi:putative transport protein